MTRLQVLANFSIRNSRITNLGKFEGEMLYVPHYWACYLEGLADADDGKVMRFNVLSDERVQFPELEHKRIVSLVEDDQGFVREV